MNNIKKLSALLSAIIMACGTVLVSPANVFAKEQEQEFGKSIRKIETDVKKLDNTKIDVNKDGDLNFYDVRTAERYINDLYQTRNTDYYQKNDDGSITYNSLVIKNNNDAKYDLNKDNVLSPDDYCSLLYAITSKFSYTVSENDGANSEVTATITGFSAENTDKEIVIPGEIYDIKTDRIYPVTAISENAFSGITTLEKVEFVNYEQPNWIDEFGKRLPTRGMITASNPLVIKKNAFKDCTSLKEVIFPENISIDKTSFENTPFFNDSNNNKDYNGVKVLKGSPAANGTVSAVAYDIDFSRAVDQNGNLTIPACVTAISVKIAENKADAFTNLIFERNENNSFNIKFIGEDAFCGCKNLATVNYASFANSDSYLKDQMYKYNSSFNSTAFMTEETERQLDMIEAKIRNTANFDKMNDAEKALIAAKYIAYNVYYTRWYTSANEFSLYPTCLYSSLDLARSCCCSENAGMNVRFTVCDGIAKTYSLVLDRIGVKNLLMGLPAHTTNQIYVSKFTDKNGNEIGGKWYKFDITGCCNERAYEVMENLSDEDDLSTFRGFDNNVDIDNCDSDIVKKMTLSREFLQNLKEPKDKAVIMTDEHNYDASLAAVSFYDLFRASKNKHVVGKDSFRFIYNDDNTQLLIYSCGDDLDPENVKNAAKSEKILKSYIDAGLIGFIDASDKANWTIDRNGRELVLDEKDIYDWYKVNSYLDDEFRMHDKEGNIIKDEWYMTTRINIRNLPNVHHIWFYIDSEGKVILHRPNTSMAIAFGRKGDKLYAYDKNGEPLDGLYTGSSYFWRFDNGELIDTNCF